MINSQGRYVAHQWVEGLNHLSLPPGSGANMETDLKGPFSSSMSDHILDDSTNPGPGSVLTPAGFISTRFHLGRDQCHSFHQ